MQVEPLVSIPLLYQTVDPSDSTVYYVRAVVRDTSLGTTLDTKNLASQGSGRYTSTYLAPQDGSGRGRHIDITITVYTDSGYSVLSDAYQRRVDKYLVRSTAASFGSTGGGNGGDVNYDKIKKMIEDALSDIRAALISNDDNKDLHKKIDAISAKFAPILSSVKAIVIPKPQKVDLTPVIDALEQHSLDIHQKIEDKPVTKIEPTDLTPVSEKMDETSAKVDKVTELVQALESTIKESMQSTAEEAAQSAVRLDQGRADKISNLVKELQGVAGSERLTPPSPPAPQEPKVPEILSPYLKK